MKHSFKNIIYYLILSIIGSLITVYYAKNTILNITLFFEGLIYYFIVILLNNLIIRYFYLKKNINSFFRILINIILGLLLLSSVRYIFIKVELYHILSFDFFIVFLIPALIIIDVNLDNHINKAYAKYNHSLRSYRNNK